MSEVPYSDDDIEILFSTLELSLIFKLWMAVLSERHVILVSHQQLLLYHCSSAIITLLFPFKYMHTFIPVLPLEFAELLEAPTPYFIGVLGKMLSFEDIVDLMPHHVVVDLDTSIIHCNNIVELPKNDEKTLRTKLNILRFPNLFRIDSIGGSIQNEIEDLDKTRKFDENVQFMFARVFFKYFGNVTKLESKGQFQKPDFIDQFSESEAFDFVETVANTLAFDYFHASLHFKDNSFASRFKKLSKDLPKNMSS